MKRELIIGLCISMILIFSEYSNIGINKNLVLSNNGSVYDYIEMHSNRSIKSGFNVFN